MRAALAANQRTMFFCCGQKVSRGCESTWTARRGDITRAPPSDLCTCSFSLCLFFHPGSFPVGFTSSCVAIHPCSCHCYSSGSRLRLQVLCQKELADANVLSPKCFLAPVQEGYETHFDNQNEITLHIAYKLLFCLLSKQPSCPNCYKKTIDLNKKTILPLWTCISMLLARCFFSNAKVSHCRGAGEPALFPHWNTKWHQKHNLNFVCLLHSALCDVTKGPSTSAKRSPVQPARRSFSYRRVSTSYTTSPKQDLSRAAANRGLSMLLRRKSRVEKNKGLNKSKGDHNTTESVGLFVSFFLVCSIVLKKPSSKAALNANCLPD